jgi:hypothetical protein
VVYNNFLFSPVLLTNVLLNLFAFFLTYLGNGHRQKRILSSAIDRKQERETTSICTYGYCINVSHKNEAVLCSLFFFLLKFYSKLCNRKGINKSKRKKYAHHMSESVRIEEIESKSCLYIYKHTFCAFFCKKSAFHLHTFYSNGVN